MLQIRNLSKSFSGRRAVDRVSFEVAKGEVLGFLGPNGAGKSTTMRMIAGALLPDTGEATIGGHSILSARRDAQGELGFLPEGAPLYDDMTPPQFLTFIGRARGMPAGPRHDAIDRVIADTRIADVTGKQIGALSKGYRRRVGLAGALLHDPSVLVLDEPTDGLDPNQKRTVRALIRRMAATKAILISTHSLEEVPAVCTRVLVVDHGRIVSDAAPEALAEGRSLEQAFADLTDGQEPEAA